ncbi:coiled-coil domain-containing protein 96-like [Amphibalanus amphitrite]|uniref:coiled-coil domain-containing protein 96-like n=1 Tax=Amphibalanus amphitrite TaxID=1232801 RepID=UPI001C91FD62|nr:coiled-coil domain-containing protein 96-like [Amphibalanus amphitrite]
MAEEGEVQEVPVETTAAEDPAQQTEEVPSGDASAPAGEGAGAAPEAEAVEQTPAADPPEGPPDPGDQGAQEGSPAPPSPEGQQAAAEPNGESAVQPIPEPGAKEGENVIPTEGEPEGGAAPLSEAVPQEVESGDTPAISASQQETGEATHASTVGGQPSVAEDEASSLGKGEEEEDSGVTDTTSQQPEDEEDTASAAEQTTERGSAESTSVHTPEDESTSDRSSAEEATTPGSADSGGRSSLTRLVERSNLEQQHRALLLLRRQLLARNQRLQQRLSQHFSRKTDDAAERVEKNVGELEARYSRYLNGIREQQRFTDEERERRQQELAAFRAQVEQQSELVASAYAEVVDLRRQVALKSRSSRTGRLMAASEVEALISREQQKEVEVQEARLESLRRETRLNRLEQTLRESEELAGGIHLIDFEQLKIENQTYAEKIEERNEDLTKLRRKISSTVQILTHLKERIQFEQTENTRRREHLETVSAEVTHGRESLAQLKQRRDQVRNRTASQRATAGLLGHEALLRDFEARVDEEARLVRELQTLKKEYADHQRMTQEIRQTVRARKQQQHDKRHRSASKH